MARVWEQRRRVKSYVAMEEAREAVGDYDLDGMTRSTQQLDSTLD